MADYFVAEGGSNTAPYDTWAKAATSLQTALTAATGDNDRVIIQYDGVPTPDDAEVGADTTYTFGGNIALIASTNSGTSTVTPTAMGAANWIGNSTTNRSITLAGAFRVHVYGVTFRTAGTTSDSILLGSTNDSHYEFDSCYFWSGNTGTAARIRLGTGTSTNNIYTRAVNCTFRVGGTNQPIRLGSGRIVLENCTLSSAGSAPTTLFELDYPGPETVFIGCDFSHAGTANLAASATDGAKTVVFQNCKLGSGYVALAAQSPANKGSGVVWIFDCAAGDEHYHLQYHDAFGSLTTDTAIYANDGAQYDGTNYCSWKIVTTANCSFYTPFVSPWFDVYHSGTSAVTPSIEILRDGSATAYQNDEVWGEWAYKGTTGSTQTTLVNDRKALTAAAANQDAGVGTSGWTGENATAWSGKLAGASITPAEIGHIRGRVLVGEPSITVYVDPQTRLA